MEHEDDNPSRISGVRRTRSQASPQWSAHHPLILVNGIAAIEADCSYALSSFQKWKIIVDNCSALGVPQSSNQCRSKWNLLLLDYKQIKRWESQAQSVLCDSYWSLGGQRRKQYQLPHNFEEDLFKAIDDVVRLLEDKSGTDRDSDPEAQDDTLEIIADLAPRKQRRKLMPLRSQAQAKSNKRCAVKKSEKIQVVEQPQESYLEEQLRISEAEEISWRTEAEKNPENNCMGIKKYKFSIEEEEEEGRILVAILCENAEQIHTLVEESFSENADRGMLI